MAIFHCSIKTVSRSTGRSAPAAAAYRSGERIKDERTGEVYNYANRQGVEHTELVLPDGVDLDRGQLWNAAEAAENRKNSTVAREYELALPDELTPDQRAELARDFARHLVERYGVAADIAIHAPGQAGDHRNHHAHILTTTRKVTPDGFGAKTRALDEKKSGEVEHIRATWAELTNRALERAGHDARIDPRSLKAQSIKRMPSTHLGASATAMERRGLRTKRGDRNKSAAQINAEIKTLENARRELEAVSVTQTPPPTVSEPVRRTGQQTSMPQLGAPGFTFADLVGEPLTPEEKKQRLNAALAEKKAKEAAKQEAAEREAAAKKAADEREADRALVEQERPKVEEYFLRMLNVEPEGKLEDRKIKAKGYADEWAAHPAAEREGYKERQSKAIRDTRPEIRAAKKQARGQSYGLGG